MNGLESVFALPEVEEGDYGLVLAEVALNGEWQVVYYDDDEQTCCYEPPCRECGEECELNVASVCYPGGALGVGGYYLLPHEALRKLPAGVGEVVDKPGAEGWVYAVAMVPEISMGRLKIGWTTNLTNRLKQYRTGNPAALLLGAWATDRGGEDRAHVAAERIGRARRWGRSEVFDCDRPFEVIAAVDAMFKGAPL